MSWVSRTLLGVFVAGLCRFVFGMLLLGQPSKPHDAQSLAVEVSVEVLAHQRGLLHLVAQPQAQLVELIHVGRQGLRNAQVFIFSVHQPLGTPKIREDSHTHAALEAVA